MEDADEAVAEGPEGLVVGVFGGAAFVVEGAGAGAFGDRAEGPEVAAVGEVAVAGVAGEDCPAFSGGFGDG